MRIFVIGLQRRDFKWHFAQSNANDLQSLFVAVARKYDSFTREILCLRYIRYKIYIW